MNIEVIDNQNILGKTFTVYRKVGDLSYDEPYFLASDIANWIDWEKSVNNEYNIVSLLKLVSDDEKEKITIDWKAQWFVTEFGLFEILFQSRKPIAKAFKKKVKEWLKTLRTQGVVEIKCKSKGVNHFLWK